MRFRQPRLIPCLLLRDRGLVKTVKFKHPTYLGDPINAVKIFNDKEVDELVVLDVTATREGRGPAIDFLREIASECFMPLSYGGGIRNPDEARAIVNVGIEKVIINSEAVKNPLLVRQIADVLGSSSVVVSIDVKKNWRGRYAVCIESGTRATGLDPVRFAAQMVQMGAGEILLSSIERDGTMRGYDLNLIKQVASAVDIPVIACGGAATIQDLVRAIRQGKACAAAAGSLFVFQGKHRAVLINYPPQDEIRAAFDGIQLVPA